jgi:beta-galactosidase GanA
MSALYYGVAYYDEYMPEERLEKDIALMLETGINVVRIAESTWSTLEPAEGEYNFYHIDRVLNAMHNAGIAVIVGTPTYAIPSWLATKHPEVMVTTVAGQQKYGPRQQMDIVSPVFRRYAENIIRKLLEHVQHHPAIIGWQLDNETKHYDNVGKYMQAGFVRSMREKYPSLDQLNKDFGLDYWSNRIDSWDSFRRLITPLMPASPARFHAISVSRLQTIWPGRRILFANMLNPISLLLITSISNGAAFRSVFSHVSITSQRRKRLALLVLIFTIRARIT